MIKTKSSPRRFSAVLATAALVLSGFAGASAPAYASETKRISISGFAPNSVALTASMKQRIDRFIKANDEYSFVSCVGFADRAGSATANNALGEGRAEAGCDQAESASSEVEVVSSRGRWDRIRSGANIRRVEITLSKSATSASAGFTTYFEYMGAEKGIAQVRTLADGTLVLPTPTRPGFEFLGWFNQQFNGTKIGNGGDTYKPNRTRILWAQWFVPSSGGGSASGGASSSGGPSWISLVVTTAVSGGSDSDRASFCDPNLSMDWTVEDNGVAVRNQADTNVLTVGVEAGTWDSGTNTCTHELDFAESSDFVTFPSGRTVDLVFNSFLTKVISGSPVETTLGLGNISPSGAGGWAPFRAEASASSYNGTTQFASDLVRQVVLKRTITLQPGLNVVPLNGSWDLTIP